MKYFLIFMALGAFPAFAESPIFSIQAPQKAYEQWGRYDIKCRGDSGDSPKSWEYCGRRDLMTEILADNGHCPSDSAQASWRKCANGEYFDYKADRGE